MSFHAATAVLILALFAVSAFAQPSLLDDLRLERAKYPTPMASEQIGQMLNDVAGRHPGWVLLLKTAGHRCPAAGTWVSCDILIFAKTGQAYDVLLDSEGTAQPTWDALSGQVDRELYVMPIRTDDPPPPPEPFERVLEALRALKAAVDALASRPPPTYRGSLLGIPITVRPEAP